CLGILAQGQTSGLSQATRYGCDRLATRSGAASPKSSMRAVDPTSSAGPTADRPGPPGQKLNVGRDRLAVAPQEVEDRGELSVGVSGRQGLRALNEPAKHLGLALCQQAGGLDNDAASIGRVGTPSGEAGLFQAVDDGRHTTGGKAERLGQVGG